jgi:hypothetical protein
MDSLGALSMHAIQRLTLAAIAAMLAGGTVGCLYNLFRVRDQLFARIAASPAWLSALSERDNYN